MVKWRTQHRVEIRNRNRVVIMSVWGVVKAQHPNWVEVEMRIGTKTFRRMTFRIERGMTITVVELKKDLKAMVDDA